jgi:hypothetical protein
MVSEMRQKEFQVIQEEIVQRETPLRKLSELKGVCSYKMPKIRVEAKDNT